MTTDTAEAVLHTHPVQQTGNVQLQGHKKNTKNLDSKSICTTQTPYNL
jgi:hypothetical protein